ncbi:hypothetical protein PF005_g31830 [Phytophthora fragariae]|uniref:Uncharacterized protein n=1 Tax=Phytophthora fragariae TaxID=53985 RepID=A0A6A3V993_9STRA|nr:hypothetical protein PF009_g31859 [Phytophthora fragariae]KAE8956081.1 hypothetical protein PF011_g31596 [Phytophthora fragariae]KAE9057177.1 hypothetical protein PF010_g31478 [Phytophthora fragariae]KAE9060217.1 hypothetical protein PF006_g31701 [Phytophthora fragariae]KAE9159981.1 hypothetical protein PF005_g31830 [Phytophthora fragariae]
MGEDKPAPLLAVKLLFRCKGRFVDLPHVLEAVSLFLDSVVELPLHVACKRGSLQLLDRLWASSEVFVKNITESDEECDEREENDHENESFTLRKFLRTDRHYTQYQFTNSLVVAIDSKNLEMVKWLVDKFQGYIVRSEECLKRALWAQLRCCECFTRTTSAHWPKTLELKEWGSEWSGGPRT